MAPGSVSPAVSVVVISKLPASGAGVSAEAEGVGSEGWALGDRRPGEGAGHRDGDGGGSDEACVHEREDSLVRGARKVSGFGQQPGREVAGRQVGCREAA